MLTLILNQKKEGLKNNRYKIAASEISTQSKELKSTNIQFLTFLIKTKRVL